MNPLLKDIFAEAKQLIQAASDKNLTIATAESCTGGLIGAAITAISGSSQVFKGGIIAYDNEIKQSLLAVPAAMLKQHGAVSHDVAKAMAIGALSAVNVDIAVSVTGIAGPGGGSDAKPVGTVWIGSARRGNGDEITAQAALYNFGDIGRNKVRDMACYEALKNLNQEIAPKS
jgi:PncC family amidohydrolase